MKTKTLFLCGLKSCGKTYFAQKLSNQTKILWLDSDQEILKLNEGYSSCRELYKAVGPEAFRAKESQAILSTIERLESLKAPAVVSLGGGVCDANNSLKLIKEHGILVYLEESEQVLYQRLLNDGLPPYLGDKPEEAFHVLYEKRDKIYSCFANYVVKLSKWSEKDVLNQLKELLLDH